MWKGWGSGKDRPDTKGDESWIKIDSGHVVRISTWCSGLRWNTRMSYLPPTMQAVSRVRSRDHETESVCWQKWVIEALNDWLNSLTKLDYKCQMTRKASPLNILTLAKTAARQPHFDDTTHLVGGPNHPTTRVHHLSGLNNFYLKTGKLINTASFKEIFIFVHFLTLASVRIRPA